MSNLPAISRDYSDYMIPQIDVSLTEFTWNFRELKFAIHWGNYADFIRIADYIGNIKFRQFLFEILPEIGTILTNAKIHRKSPGNFTIL